MAYSYFTKKLLAKSNEIDLSKIFADKQEQAKTKLNINYSLPQIVQWIRDNTDDFKRSENYFIDVDQAIERVVNKYYQVSNLPNPFVSEEIEVNIAQPRVPSSVASKGVESTATVVSETVEQVLEEVLSLKEAIAYLQDEADAGDEESKEALEYLKQELESLTETIK